MIPGKALVVMAYGTPASPEDVEPYYTHIRRGRRPSLEQLDDLRRRYEAIGGVSPLAQLTARQAEAIADALERVEPGVWQMSLGNKHVTPFLEDAVGDLLEERPEVMVGLVMAPHWSWGSVAQYHERAAAVVEDTGGRYVAIDAWCEEPAWLDAQADRVQAGLGSLPASTRVLFTAHSLPERILVDDPYADQLHDSAAAIAERAGLDPSAWSLAWQSAGRTPEPWRGPDVCDVIRELGETEGVDGVLVCPQGFVSDHLEVLYDLDIEASRVAAGTGLAFGRTASINDDPAVMTALANRVRRATAEVG